MTDNKGKKSFTLVIDSGIGGLTAFNKIRLMYPSKRLVYLADTAFFPYGEKSEIEILERIHFLIEKHLNNSDHGTVDGVFLACHTASYIVDRAIKEEKWLLKDIPIMGMLPSVREAIVRVFSPIHPSTYHDYAIIILGTDSLVKSDVYQNIMPGITVFKKSCSDLVRFIERGILNGEKIEKSILGHLDSIFHAQPQKHKIVILACTHFPYLMPLFKKLDSSAVYIDPSDYLIPTLAPYINRTMSQNLCETNNNKDNATILATHDVLGFHNKIQNIYNNYSLSA